MTSYVVRRILTGLPLILVVPLMIFLLVDLVPGDPASILAGESATPERVEAMRAALGLNDPVLVRYFLWLQAAFTGDLGVSYVSTQTVAELIGRRIGTTVSLVAVTAVLSVIAGFGLAILATLRRGGFIDRAINAATSIAIALPPFWVGLILVAVFAVQIPLLPTSGFVPFSENPSQWIVHLTLPAIALSLLPAAEIALHLRASLGQELSSDYIVNARAKGLSEVSVVFKHALKNAAIPVVTVFGYRISEVLAGTVTIEIIYNMPGLGRLAVDSVQSRDIPVLLAFVLFSTAVVVAINLIVDLSYGYFNPKVRS